MASCRNLLTAVLALAWILASPAAMAQAKRDIAISRQPGVLYMPTHVIEKQKLIEKHAAKLGMSGIDVKWLYFSNGGAQQDALISGGVDIVNSATGQLLLLWDRTKGGVKGIVATSHQPLFFVTRDDRIKSLKDIGPGDKIAVPTVRISSQSILLQMAAVQLFGADKWSYFDPFTIQMGHPDALAAMSNPTHEVRNHFAAPPFHRYELKQAPGARVVIASSDIVGGPLTQSQFFAMTKFTDANPVIVQALRAAAEEAKAFIESQTADAVAIYKEISGDKTSDADLLDLLSQPEMMQWELYPQGTMKYAHHLHATGSLKTKPASWKDYYLPIAHDLPGN